ncbi:hypothetical protein [Neotabrizicola sp. VNH66]|uniref:hypothetical protein n=1 Tax=Neotabrizicola sp. VNH66 TaxID=3400918 RepID=UPI003C018880
MSDAAASSDAASVLADWRADPGIYWKNHLILAAVFAVLAAAVLWAIGNPHVWTGPLAAILAVFVRAAYLRSEALAARWTLTRAQLSGPQGRLVPLSSVAEVKIVLGDVLVVTRAGDKHLIKYLADPEAARAAIERAAR